MTTSRYEVLARIATGGMGSVFVGRYKAQLGVSRLVALKRPHPFILADPRLRRRVIDEARTASAIHHANVVAVVDVELIEDEPVLVLDYVEGATLAELVRSAAASTTYDVFAPIAVRILLDTARGLGAAHALGILHRDVTPQNVLVGLEDGVSRLSDFGIAKSTVDGVAEPTVSGSIKGKLGYLAPEVLAAREFVISSDLFALAVVAWEALTLCRLFGGGTDVETLARVVALERPPLEEQAPLLASFEALFARALAREPADRPASAAAFANELEALARASCGIASPSEVAAFVEGTFGEPLRARRAELDASRARPVEEIDQLPLRPPSPRDDIETASVNDAQPPRRARRWPLLAGVVGLGVVATIVALRHMRPAPALTPAPAAVEPIVIAPSNEPAPPPVAVPAVSAEVVRAPAPRPRPVIRAAAPKPSAAGFPTHAPPNPYAH